MFSSTQSKDPHYLSGFTRYYNILINTDKDHSHYSPTQSKDPHYLSGFTR